MCVAKSLFMQNQSKRNIQLLTHQLSVLSEPLVDLARRPCSRSTLPDSGQHDPGCKCAVICIAMFLLHKALPAALCVLPAKLRTYGMTRTACSVGCTRYVADIYGRPAVVHSHK